MIFYFTGTGNSLYAAKQIEKDPISIPHAIHQKNKNFTSASIGIVSPIYGHELPAMVKDFLKKSVFSTNYFYMILTYGNRHGGAAELAKSFCDSIGLSVHYINVLLMVDNWLPSFDMDEQKKIDKRVDENLAVIKSHIKEHKNMISEVTESDREAHRQFMSQMSLIPPDAWQRLIKIGTGCVGCGICERVCPSSSIRIENGKAVHIPGNCQSCLACVHACTQKVIGLSVPEKNPNARYRNKDISLNEIMKANCQVKGIKE